MVERSSGADFGWIDGWGMWRVDLDVFAHSTKAKMRVFRGKVVTIKLVREKELEGLKKL